MHFSNFAARYQKSTGTVRLMEDLGAATSASGCICQLGGGNPAHIPEVEDLLREAMADLTADTLAFGKMIGEYDAPGGNVAFRETLANLLTEQFGWPLTQNNIAITNGSQSSFGLLFNSFAGSFPDDSHKRILLPLTPEYVGYFDVGLAEQPIFEGRRAEIDLLPNRQFKYRVDFESLQLNQSHGAVCVSRPTNPTGNVITDREMDQLRGECHNAGIPLIVDGAYGLPFPGMIFTPATPFWDANTILLLSLSKLGLPGLRTGIVVAAPEIIQLIQNTNAINTLAPSRVGPTLLTPLLQQGKLQNICDELIRPYYERKRDQALQVIEQVMDDLPVRVHKPEGALFLWLWFDGLPITSEALYQELMALGVFVLPSRPFYPSELSNSRHQDECIRVNYAASEGAVTSGLTQIAQVVRSHF
ncbi:MAG: valine--pyruvate transaminase [Luminiphilus sp.]|jgi:valine--pyruvate aminotransferase|nr:valine--pyruvate transaminase [Luminiphilus sp.]MDG1461884.1 valine--pyruvate transaminase [Luminiphilus sp.]